MPTQHRHKVQRLCSVILFVTIVINGLVPTYQSMLCFAGRYANRAVVSVVHQFRVGIFAHALSRNWMVLLHGPDEEGRSFRNIYC